MAHKLSRRRLLSCAGGAALVPSAGAMASIWVQGSSPKPIVVSSANGNQFTNGGAETCVVKAFRLITEGSDVLDAVIAGVNLNELDPKDASVGYGGIPNADGVVELDSCCMHGPKKWAGGVAAIQGVRTPSLVAKAVAEQTDHHLIVAEGAQRFARAMGFTIEADLNTDNSRRIWREWKRRTDPEHYLDPAKRDGKGARVALQLVREGWIDPDHYYGTINCNGLNAAGDLCGVTTTSGLAFKIPGRVGDSPILGAGLYVDNALASVGSTGRGEANLYNLCSFLIVEELRRGATPVDAGFAALKRVAANTEKRLLNDRNQPNFGLNFYILDKRGRHAGVGFSGRASYAVCDAGGPRFVECKTLY
ncbi:MAG: N(4)-(beta-N-acetylglucosaminyl)-L-asparaginase [Fimbriimonadaceae bacterium]